MERERLEFIRSLNGELPHPAAIIIGDMCQICPTSKLGNEGFGFEPDEYYFCIDDDSTHTERINSINWKIYEI